MPTLVIRLSTLHPIFAAVVQTMSAYGYAGLPEQEKSAMEEVKRLEELFAGRHFDREVILLCAVVSSVQAQPPRPG